MGRAPASRDLSRDPRRALVGRARPRIRSVHQPRADRHHDSRCARSPVRGADLRGGLHRRHHDRAARPAAHARGRRHLWRGRRHCPHVAWRHPRCDGCVPVGPRPRWRRTPAATRRTRRHARPPARRWRLPHHAAPAAHSRRAVQRAQLRRRAGRRSPHPLHGGHRHRHSPGHQRVHLFCRFPARRYRRRAADRVHPRGDRRCTAARVVVPAGAGQACGMDQRGAAHTWRGNAPARAACPERSRLDIRNHGRSLRVERDARSIRDGRHGGLRRLPARPALRDLSRTAWSRAGRITRAQRATRLLDQRVQRVHHPATEQPEGTPLDSQHQQGARRHAQEPMGRADRSCRSAHAHAG